MQKMSNRFQLHNGIRAKPRIGDNKLKLKQEEFSGEAISSATKPLKLWSLQTCQRRFSSLKQHSNQIAQAALIEQLLNEIELFTARKSACLRIVLVHGAFNGLRHL
jgi:hypothetical protein